MTAMGRYWSLQQQQEPLENPLTQQMMRVLQAAAAGMSVKETAAAMWVTRETVITHRAHVRARLGARTMAHAVFLALKRGLIS